MKRSKHFLIAADESVFKEFESFNAVEIKKSIVEYLAENPKGMLTHEKECKNDFNDVINCYENNPNTNEASRVVERNERKYYIRLS